jgi:hypothetical protein
MKTWLDIATCDVKKIIIIAIHTHRHTNKIKVIFLSNLSYNSFIQLTFMDCLFHEFYYISYWTYRYESNRINHLEKDTDFKKIAKTNSKTACKVHAVEPMNFTHKRTFWILK